MREASIRITGPAGTRTETLCPQGSTFGRGRMCDVILNDESVSRLHARVFQDAGGNWKIEDLDSHNGVIVEGKRVMTHTLSFNQTIEISCFTMTLQEEPSGPVSDQVPGTEAFENNAGETIISYRPESATILGPALLQAFNSFSGNLMEMSNSAELYVQACRWLQESTHGDVAILQLERPIPEGGAQPMVLALADTGETGVSQEKDSGFRFSQAVLAAACSTGEPVMTNSHPVSDQDLSLTIVDSFNPRVVFAAPVNKMDDIIDLLYVDLPAGNVTGAMFDFIEAVSRQINFVQKNLYYRELQKTEQALREANSELKAKDRIKDEYVSRITHDIKGHLGAIKSCLAIVHEDSGIGSVEKKAEFLDRASDRTTQLLGFIADLLRITKLRLSGQMEEKEFSLQQVITRSLDTVAPGAKDKNITLEAEVGPTVNTMTGDELSINEVITNLLFNAIKYSPENESISLQALTKNDQVFISISDTGIGIPEDEVDQVFQEFFRASNAMDFAKDGTGLGLALVKQIVERHGGTIAAKNNSGKGTTFSIVLPLQE